MMAGMNLMPSTPLQSLVIVAWRRADYLVHEIGRSLGLGVEYFFSEKWGVKLNATAVVNPGDLDNGNDNQDFTGYGVFSVARRF